MGYLYPKLIYEYPVKSDSHQHILKIEIKKTILFVDYI